MNAKELAKKRRAALARMRAKFNACMGDYYRPLPSSEDCIRVNASTGEVTYGANVTPEQQLAFELRQLGIK